MRTIKITERYFLIRSNSFKNFILIQTLPFKLFFLPKKIYKKSLLNFISRLNKVKYSIDLKEFSGYFALDIVISTFCNLRCTYCCALSSKIKGYYGLKAENMNFLTAKRVIDLALKYFEKELTKKKTTIGRFDLFITGGEPLLNFPVLKFLLENLDSKLKELSIKLKIPIEFSPEVATNGVLINNEVAKVFKKYNVQSAITLDGPWHDERRVYPNKKGSSKDVLKGLKILISNKNLIKLQSVISFDKISQVNKIFKYYEENKLLNSIKAVNIIPQAAPIFDRYLIKNKKKIPRVDENLYKNYGFLIFDLSKKFGLDVKNYQERLFRSIQFGGLAYRCAASLWKLSVAPDGSIYPCHQLTNIKEFYMGNVNNPAALNNHINRVKAKFRKRTVFHVKPCSDCLFQTICIPFVDCPARCYIETGSLFTVPEYYCKIHKPYMEKLFEEFIAQKINY